ncbi:MAG: hypothetical protein LBU14_02640 [Candidatus Peribacteria bacterium]|jgi:hypothetical protein|nr:hypothetical protein [Candidatus Peribacteria bacterium]
MIRNIQKNDLIHCARILEREYSKSPYFEEFEENNSLNYIKSKYKNNTGNAFVIEENSKII